MLGELTKQTAAHYMSRQDMNVKPNERALAVGKQVIQIALTHLRQNPE